MFSPRRIERATHRDIGVRCVAANLRPAHDTTAALRRVSRAGFEATFLQVLLLARESGLRWLGTVAIDGTKLGANASALRSIRSDRATQLRAKLAADIAELTAKAEAADAAAQPDPRALPGEIARRCALMRRSDTHEHRPPRRLSPLWRIAAPSSACRASSNRPSARCGQGDHGATRSRRIR
jgi:hypothetical protein